jgi:hypothetical protein
MLAAAGQKGVLFPANWDSNLLEYGAVVRDGNGQLRVAA